MTRKRVVVTGMGVITPIGHSVDELWSNSLKGVSGVSHIDAFDTSNHRVKIGAGIKNFDPAEYMDPKDARRYDEFIQIGCAAAVQAVRQAGIEQYSHPNRVGVAIGSGIGGIRTICAQNELLQNRGPRRVSPFFIPASIANMISGLVSIDYGFKGPNISIVTACTTGAHNIGFGVRMIQHGDADVMVAGGAEWSTAPVSVAGFSAMRALSTRNDDPEKASRPWDRDRDGFVLGDGAGVLVLESYESASTRGADILAEVRGFGMSADAHHITGPPENGEGAVQSMRNALADAQISTDQIQYVNAHGTSTPLGDVVEARAIKSVFGADTKVMVSSTKSMVGHLLGAAGAVESIISILVTRDNHIPPTINLEDPDDECDLDFVPGTAREATVNMALSNSFGFGGTNGTVIFSQV